MREVNALRDIDELSSRLYDTNNPSKWSNKDGLLEQYYSLKGTCGLIYALISNEEGKPELVQYLAYK